MAATYQPISTTTLGSSQSSVTFNTLGTYTDIVMSINAGESVGEYLKLTFNSDTGSNYSRTFMYGTGSSAVSSRASNATSIFLNCGTTSANGAILVHLQNYRNTNIYKTVIARNAMAGSLTMQNVGLWRNTDAITSITLTGGDANILAGSTFTIYGIQAA